MKLTVIGAGLITLAIGTVVGMVYSLIDEENTDYAHGSMSTVKV